MSDHIDLFPKTVQEGCDEVANKLGYLPLAIDLAGAYIGNNLAPEHVPTQYLEDYGKHRVSSCRWTIFEGLPLLREQCGLYGIPP